MKRPKRPKTNEGFLLSHSTVDLNRIFSLVSRFCRGRDEDIKLTAG